MLLTIIIIVGSCLLLKDTSLSNMLQIRCNLTQIEKILMENKKHSRICGVCWFPTLLQEVFPRVLQFSPLTKNQHLILFDL